MAEIYQTFNRPTCNGSATREIHHSISDFIIRGASVIEMTKFISYFSFILFLVLIGIAEAQTVEYTEVTKSDREIFTSIYRSEKDMYFVDMITKSCRRRNLSRRHGELNYSEPDNAIQMQLKPGGLNCGIEVVSVLDKRVTVNDKLIGWTLSAKKDFCLVPAVNVIQAELFNRCNMVGCRLNIPAGTTMTFVSPLRDVAAAIYDSVDLPRSIKQILDDDRMIDKDRSTELTRRCPPERY